MYKLGIDLGGTNIAAGVVDEKFNIIGTASVKTNCPRPAEEIADDMKKAALAAVKNAGVSLDDIESVGIGAPGSINNQDGTISYSNNLGFYDVDLGKMMSERLGRPVFLENDANAAAYGEFLAGAGKGTKNFVAITLGTGVGSGIIVDGKIYSGHNFAGGEIGHTVIAMDGECCTCGRNGCWEAYASATALVRQTKQAMTRYPKTVMWKLCDGDINRVNGRTAFDAMRQGDEAGKFVVDKYINYIAVGISNVINIFQPEVLCIGGGISKEGKLLTDPINAFVSGEDYARTSDKRTVIKTAVLGNDAGIIGAAYLANLH